MRESIIAAVAAVLAIASTPLLATTWQARADDTVNLSGPWVSSDYQCPGGTKHNEQLLITQNGSQISAVKTAGDDCVPTGHESFTGTVTGNSGMMRFWTGAPGVQPFLGAANEKLVIQDANTFVRSGPAGNYTVTRATTSN
jgi:uncharacterized protein YgiM (DUF1202 family)